MGNKMNKVLPGLYIGSARDAHDVEELKKNKISHILSVHENAKPDLRDKIYMCLPIADSPSQNIAYYFAQCNVFIHKARRAGNVLVHCQMGVSRSAAVVVAYLMTVTRLGWKDALTALKAVRPFVSPNLGFQQQLMIYEQKYVEEERTRLKTLFPLIQFDDTVHCDELLEKYRLSRLRTEQPMDVDIYPLALNAYGPKDFASLRLESAPANVVFCGPVSNPSSEEDCLIQRLQNIHLTETFTRVDTLSCGCRPSSVIGKKADVHLPNDEQETRGIEMEKNSVGGNVLRPSMLSNVVLEYRSNDQKSNDQKSNDQKSPNDAAVESFFSNSVNVSKNSVNNGATQESRSEETGSTEGENNSVNGTTQVSNIQNSVANESRSNETNAETLESFFSNSLGIANGPAIDDPKKNTESGSQASDSTNEAVVDSIFSNSVGGFKSSTNKRSGSQVKDAPEKPKVSSQVTEKDLREIGRAYLRRHVNTWHDMSVIEDDDEEILPPVKTMNTNPSQTKITSYDPTQITIIGNNPFRTKTMSNKPTPPKITSNDPNQVMIDGNNPQVKITSNDPTQLKIPSNDPTPPKITSNDPNQVMIIGSNPQVKITSNDPTQRKIPSNYHTQIRIVGNNHSQASNNPTQKRLSCSSVEEEITLLPSRSQLDQLFGD